jgi:2'-5' RNA ligase
MFETPTYIVLDLPQPESAAITQIRRHFDGYMAELPPEITVAGSSGLGVLSSQQSHQVVFTLIERICDSVAPIKTAFTSIERFPNTQIFWLKPHDREPLDLLHNVLRSSGISFDPSPFPYNPHCTISAQAALTAIQEKQIMECVYPKGEFSLDAISMYQLKGTKAIFIERFPFRRGGALTPQCSQTTQVAPDLSR